MVVEEECCTAGSDDLHHKELEIINMIYCHVLSSRELKSVMGLGECHAVIAYLLTG